MDLEKLRPLVNTALWSLFEEYVETLRALKLSELINADDEKRIYASQAQVKLLNELISLKEKANAKH